MDRAWRGNTLLPVPVFAQNSMCGTPSCTGSCRNVGRNQSITTTPVGAVSPRGRSYTEALRFKSVVICYLFLYLSDFIQPATECVRFYFAMSFHLSFLHHSLCYFLALTPVLSLCFNPFCIPLCQTPQGQLLPFLALHS